MPGLELDLITNTTKSHSNTTPDRSAILRRGLRLEYLSVGWNLVEGGIAIGAGLVAASVALIGFGVDSFVESASASVIVWRIISENRNKMKPDKILSIEQQAQKLVAISLLIFGLFLLFESISSLASREQPDVSQTGMILAVLSICVMWWIARSIRQVGKQLHSHAIEADATQTLACWWMSISLLIGLGLNAAFGWWWADPLAGIVISILMLREARNAWNGKDCCNL